MYIILTEFEKMKSHYKKVRRFHRNHKKRYQFFGNRWFLIFFDDFHTISASPNQYGSKPRNVHPTRLSNCVIIQEA